MKLQGLQEWIEGIIATPIIELDARYSWFGDYEHYREAKNDIQAIPFYIRERPSMHRVTRETLHRLHQKVRGHGCESNIWDSVRWEMYEVTSPDGVAGLPAPIAHDFIDRDMTDLMGHLSYSPHLEGVLQRLASLGAKGGRASVNLAQEFYGNPRRTPEEFAAVIEQHFPSVEMMDALWYTGTCSLEKLAIYRTYVARYSQEQYPRRQPWENSTLREELPVELEESLEVRYREQFFPAPRWQWKHFYGTDTPEELVALARDPNTPDEILQELTEIYNEPFSTRIRRNAEQNLAARCSWTEDSSAETGPSGS